MQRSNKIHIFGYDTFKGTPIALDLNETLNYHGIICAGSGSGKTYNIKELVYSLYNPIRFHVLDVHGDIDFDESICSTVKFSETSNTGLNPLTVSSDEDFGGVRRAINSFIKTMESTSRKLGEEQLPCLRNILEDVFTKNGFLANDSRTWSLDFDFRRTEYKKRYPTLEDVIKYTQYKLQQSFIGSNSKGAYALEKLNISVQTLHNQLRKTNEEITEAHFTTEKENCLNLYAEYLKNLKSGRELEELMKYDNAKVLKRILEKLKELDAIGIFKNKPPVFDNSKFIHRYDVKSLSDDELKMFADVLFKKIFFKAKSTGIKDYCTDIIICDEAHKTLVDDSSHITNIILKEGRKFGVGYWGASQSFSHFPDDVLESTGTKLLLNIDEMYQVQSARKLRIEPDVFNFIAPKKSGLINIKIKETTSKFTPFCFKQENTVFARGDSSNSQRKYDKTTKKR